MALAPRALPSTKAKRPLNPSLLLLDAMPLPATAQAMRAAAQRREARRNAIGAGVAIGFVSGVFFYCINAVSQQQDAITEQELAEFRVNRERQRRLDQLEKRSN